MNDRGLRIAAVGCGHWGRNLVRNFHALGALASVTDSNPETAAAMSRQYKVPVRATSELWQDAEVDGVVIATPAATHFSIAREALLAGKHVFVE
jgi:UDP-2-acetamido-3-amino-2,3-dideoxy-glucuronate N-acetyltransferase